MYTYTYIHIYVYLLFICCFYFMNSDIDMPRKFTYKPCRLFFQSLLHGSSERLATSARYMPKKSLQPFIMILHHKTRKVLKNPSFLCAFPGTDLGSDSGYDINLTFAPWQENPTKNFPPNGPRFRGLQKEVGKCLTMVLLTTYYLG